MGQKFKNNASSTLADTLTSGGMLLKVAALDAAKFPSPTLGDYFDLTLQDATNIEIVRVTGRTGDEMTISARGLESTTPVGFAIGTVAAIRLTAAVVEATLAHATVTTDAHDASAISILDTANNFSAVNVETALAELQAEKEVSGTAAAAISAHEAASNPHPTYLTASELTAEIGTTVQGYDATLAALAGLATGADKMPYSTGTDAFAQATLTAFARTLLDDATQAAALTTLGAVLNAVSAKTAGYTVLTTDRGKLIDFSGLSANAEAALPAVSGNAGLVFGFRNSDPTYTLTLNPNSVEDIDGVNSIDLAAGESCLVVCDGTAWKTVGRTVVPAQVKVSANDTTAGYLNGKLVAGSQITLTEGSDGGNETLTIAATGVSSDVGVSGIGMMAFLYNNTTNIASGATVSGASLLGNSVAMTGTWRNIENTQVVSYVSGNFQRIA